MNDFPAMEYKAREVEEEQVELAPGETSLDFMKKIYRDPRQPMQRRMKAAEIALQFEHQKLGTTDHIVTFGFSEALERAILRSQTGAPLKLIEGSKTQN